MTPGGPANETGCSARHGGLAGRAASVWFPLPANAVAAAAGHRAAGGSCSPAGPRGPADQPPHLAHRSIGGTHVQVEARIGPGARGPAGGHQPGRHDHRRPRPSHRCAHRQAGHPAATYPTQVGESWHQRPPTTNQSAIAGNARRPPTEGQVGEPWHLRVHPTTPPAQPDGQPSWPVASLAVLTAALALAGVLAAMRVSRRARPRLTA
jgi:hypothetical protein